MTEPRDDYLWDPGAPADAEVERLEQLLRPYSADARGLLRRTPWPKARRRWSLAAMPLAAAAALALLAVALHFYRLSWPEGAPWQLTRVSAEATATRGSLRPGQTLTTAADESATLSVARIGELSLGANSQLELLSTRTGFHRIAMPVGRLHARIWAPPGHFAVVSGDALFIDLGCEFVLDVDPSGSGSLLVTSGWVAHEVGPREVLVPAGHRVEFDAHGSGTPVREAASAAFRSALARFDATLRGSHADTDLHAPTLADLATAVAAHASDADFHSLLSLLTRFPPLADTALYPRLADVLGRADDGALHREQWRRGDPVAINQWWQRVPVQPKQWLVHWRDAL